MTALTAPTVKVKRPRKPKITPTLHEYVRRRDGACLAYLFDRHHVCAAPLGTSHAPTDLGKLTVDHVWPDGQALGLRPADTKYNLVAMCWKANVGAPSHELREFERAHLRRVEPQD